MAPTCYSHTMKNLHYRTQSLPESVYTHQMLHLTQPPDYHHGHHQLGHYQLGSGHHPSSHIKKRAGGSLRRSQTSVCDLLQSGLSHHRAPLTAGLYDQFLPPPNFNAIGLPVNNRVGRNRTQSFYVPGSHYRSSVSRLNGGLGSHHDLHSSVSPYSYPVCDQTPAWYHRSVPNISSYPTPATPAKSVTSPLFVDCSVEYDLGEQPVIPADSEPLLSIHPDYIAKCRSVPASPYDRLHMGNNNNNNNNNNKSNSKQCESHQKSAGAPQQLQHQQESSLPRRSGIGRSNRSSPRARCNLNSKLEATRKLSVESRDSGIGMMSSGWQMFNSGCDNSNFSSYPQLSDQQTEYTGKVLPSNNKRFALTDLVSGLLCCSVPPYHPQTDHHQDNNRTMEWVMASQKMINKCKMGQCNQDCGDGFCYNVWNNLVHV